MKKIKSKLTPLLAAGLLCLSTGVLAAEQTVSRAETRPVNAAEAENFIGKVWVEPYFAANDTDKAYGARVSFEAGARTNWHIHAARQVLLVTEGVGYTQEWGKPVQKLHAGDIVECPAGVKHWHGAGPDTPMTHIAISEVRGKVQWLEPVTDNQYPMS